MSRPTTPQHDHENRGQSRGRSRGQQGPVRNHGQRGQNGSHGQRRQQGQHGRGLNQRRQNSTQATEPGQVFDWFHEEFRTVDPNENQDDNSSRSSSPYLHSNRGSYQGQRGYRGRGQRRDSSESMQSNQQNKSSRYSKFFQLMRLSQLNGNDIATEISDNSDFKILLNSEMNNDRLVLTLRILAKLEEASFTRIVINILNDTCDSKFFDSLEHYLVQLTSQTRSDTKANKFYWEDVDEFWNQLHSFFKTIINLIPMEAHDILLPILELTRKYVIQTLKTKRDHDTKEDLRSRFRTLHHQLKDKGKYARVSGNDMLQDFRNLSIVPTVEDLNNHHPYIRPCKIHGAYESVDHYLDVQFRLLREDFICPLRSGIQEYKKLLDTNVRSPHNSDIRVFQKVKLIGPTVVKNKVGVTIFFGVMPKINWIRSKLFMYGSLLCLTKDNFKSGLFATVAERDPQLLGKGELVIEPCVGTQITREMYSYEYVMVESKVYFLPYYHTLHSLRYMSEDNFPMKRYVVDAESNPKPPKYLDESQIYVYKGLKIPVMDVRRWPSARYLKLDESQYDAFKCALLQELSVLHGPPGTGKTFMALQIASTLLGNSSSWYDPNHPTPMIVVCLTNHALDQFLEGILEYTDSLVRIGEQSKNPNLTKYKLKAVREEYFKDERNKHRAWQRMGYYQRQLKQVLYTLDSTYSALRACASGTSIVSPNVLRRYCDNDDELQRLTAKDLLTKLFGSNNASLALEIKDTSSNSSQSKENDESESEDENLGADDDLEAASGVRSNQSELTCLELSHLNDAIQKCEAEISQYPNNPQNNHIRAELNGKLKQLISLQNMMQTKLSRHPLQNRSQLVGVPTDRDWEVYFHWLTSSYEIVQEKVVKLEREYQELSSQLNDFKQMTDLEVMRNSKVVGLTTTGAARLHESLRALQSPIVLVEEAAEILEAHVICSLTEHCQQVILIGDHKQLRPKPATYNLEINYNLDISLFERIVKMRDKCTQLVIQHRMRPEIAKLISPSIYERLENHMSVLTYPDVKGLQKNVFFLHHENRESGSADNESMSNPFEVKFLLAFAKYLRQQGYAPHEITILCTYSGQLFKFKEAKRSFPILRDVRVTTVDNYQGEENRIILLSLVRNNNTGNVGFLRTENRVCVALSRAREGLFIMGNMKNLVMRNEIWPKIKETLENNHAIGECLVLKCQVHTDQLTEIKLPTDFRSSDGGCNRRCDAALPCSHTCQKPCHLSDLDHERYICRERCLKRCPSGHPCKLSCNVACKPCQEIVKFELKCKHTVSLPCSTNLKDYRCMTEVETFLPCGHIVAKPCHWNFLTYPCPCMCSASLPCGHSCQRTCHKKDDADHLEYLCQKDCEKLAKGCSLLSHPCPKKCHEPCTPCAIKVVKNRSCGHTHKIGCAQDVEKTICTRRCKRELTCGHACREKCYLPCGKCGEMVDKIVPECGHEVKMPCHENPTVAFCKGDCPRTLKCGHPCKAQCCEPCTKRCEYPRPLPELALCQHSFPVPCYKVVAGLAEYADKLLQHCTTLCATMLPCGHKCSGTCGSCKQGRIHQPCREKCTKILFCGHKCEALCKDVCRPCQGICSLKCEHRECRQKCCTPCVLCLEPCAWKCKHLQCKKLCSEVCDREACNEPCPKKLNCGHPCIGFCGDPCPQLCRICDKKDLPTFIVNGSQSEARFVYLPDCGHSIESNYFDWVWERSYRFGIKACPLCKTRITHCSRYTNQIKKESRNIGNVERQISLRLQVLRSDQQQIVDDISLIEDEYASIFPELNAHKKLFGSLRKLVNQQKTIGFGLLKDISTKLTINTMILRKIREIAPDCRNVDDWNVVLNQVIMVITSLPTNENLSHQMCDDIKNELSRLHYMVELCKFERENGFNWQKNALQVRVIHLGLLNLKKFTKSSSDAIHKQLLELKKSLKSTISVVELKPIVVRIIGLDQQDWYRCPNGHIYVKKCEQCLSAPSAPVE